MPGKTLWMAAFCSGIFPAHHAHLPDGAASNRLLFSAGVIKVAQDRFKDQPGPADTLEYKSPVRRQPASTGL
jgi:hypothetical protein